MLEMYKCVQNVYTTIHFLEISDDEDEDYGAVPEGPTGPSTEMTSDQDDGAWHREAANGSGSPSMAGPSKRTNEGECKWCWKDYDVTKLH